MNGGKRDHTGPTVDRTNGKPPRSRRIAPQTYLPPDAPASRSASSRKRVCPKPQASPRPPGPGPKQARCMAKTRVTLPRRPMGQLPPHGPCGARPARHRTMTAGRQEGPVRPAPGAASRRAMEAGLDGTAPPLGLPQQVELVGAGRRPPSWAPPDRICKPVAPRGCGCARRRPGRNAKASPATGRRRRWPGSPARARVPRPLAARGGRPAFWPRPARPAGSSSRGLCLREVPVPPAALRPVCLAPISLPRRHRWKTPGAYAPGAFCNQATAHTKGRHGTSKNADQRDGG